MSYAGAGAGGEGSSTGGEVARYAANRGRNVALGAAGLGWAGSVFDVAGIIHGGGRKQGGISPAFRQQCLLSGTDPVTETAKAFERRLARGKIYTLDPKAPEATFRITIVRADLAAVDQMGQAVRPTITMRATLLDRSGKILWQREGAGASAPHTWQEYGRNARLFKSDLTTAADAAAAALVAKLSG